MCVDDAVVDAGHLPFEQLSVEQAAECTLFQLGRAARRVLEYLDPDGSEPRDEEYRRRRALTLSTRWDGSGSLTGRLTPACLAILWAVLEPLSAPAPVEPRGGRIPDGDLISVPEALRLTDHAEVTSIVFDDRSGIASFGRDRRTASLGQRTKPTPSTPGTTAD